MESSQVNTKVDAKIDCGEQSKKIISKSAFLITPFQSDVIIKAIIVVDIILAKLTQIIKSKAP
jgi:hypothetical protein